VAAPPAHRCRRAARRAGCLGTETPHPAARRATLRLNPGTAARPHRNFRGTSKKVKRAAAAVLARRAYRLDRLGQTAELQRGWLAKLHSFASYIAPIAGEFTPLGALIALR